MKIATGCVLVGAALSLCAGTSAFAQTTRGTTAQPSGVPPVSALSDARPISETAARYSQNTNNEPDVFLDIPNLSVETIDITVDKLQVHLALDARLGNLLKLTAGADASIDKVKITIKGVKAQVQLKVRLDNVAAIIDRTLTTVDRNPQLIERALGTVDNTVNTVGGVANNTVGTVGGVANNALGSRAVSPPAQARSTPTTTPPPPPTDPR